jgi:hypothetical protein
VLLSFFAFIRIFIIWLAVYFYINNRRADLDRFQTRLSNLQNLYGSANRDLQNFIISGHRQPSFYSTGRQKDIDNFDSLQRLILTGIGQIREEADKNSIDIREHLDTLAKLHRQLADSTKMLRHIYITKGFKDYGAERKMRDYALFLEDSTPVQKADILMLGRWEKDFMLRGEQKYIDAFNTIIDSQVVKFASVPAINAALVRYKFAFNDWAAYSRRLGINTDHGLYTNMEVVISNLNNRYGLTGKKVSKEIAYFNHLFAIILVTTFIFLVAASIYLSIVLSKSLTRDIHKLNKHLGAFVRSGFKEDQDVDDPLFSKIAEIQGLNENIAYLKKALLKTLANLRKALDEEKELSRKLQVSITRQNNQFIITAHQQAELQQYHIMLGTLLHYTATPIIIFGSHLEVIFHNPASDVMVHAATKNDLSPGSHIYEYLPDDILSDLKAGIETALAGKEITTGYNIAQNGTPTNWNISLYPVRDDDNVVFAVVLIAEKLDDTAV